MEGTKIVPVDSRFNVVVAVILNSNKNSLLWKSSELKKIENFEMYYGNQTYKFYYYPFPAVSVLIPTGYRRRSTRSVTTIAVSTKSECIDTNHIKHTQSAIEFNTQQAKEKVEFDAREKENQQFREAVRTFTRYPNKYTLSVYWQDCTVSIWEDQCKENPLLERDSRHGYDCRKINNCSKCTPDWEVRQNEKKQAEQYRLKYFHKRKSTKQRRKKKEVARY